MEQASNEEIEQRLSKHETAGKDKKKAKRERASLRA
jgi:hypothetical protein